MIVADHYRLSELVSAFRAGANGYFVDVITCDAFIKSIEVVMMGETVFPPDFLSFVRDPGSDFFGKSEPHEQDNRPILFSTEDATAPQLSPREKTILRCLVEGDTNKSIARKIDIAEATVKVHVKAILCNIGVQNRTQAAIWAMNNGSLTRSASGTSPPQFPMQTSDFRIPSRRYPTSSKAIHRSQSTWSTTKQITSRWLSSTA